MIDNYQLLLFLCLPLCVSSFTSIEAVLHFNPRLPWGRGGVRRLHFFRGAIFPKRRACAPNLLYLLQTNHSLLSPNFKISVENFVRY